MAIPQHATLTPSSVKTFTLDQDYDCVHVASLDGLARVTFTADGSVPTVDGDGGYVLPATISALKVPVPTSGVTVVKVISAGSPFVSVMGC